MTLIVAFVSISGPMIGLEYSGEGICRICQDVLERTVNEWRRSVYVSPDSSVAAQQVEVFYSVADMMMAV